MYRNHRETPAGGGQESMLTPSSLIRLEHFAVPSSLQPFFTTSFMLECDEPDIADTLPAAVGYLTIVLQGEGSLRFASGRIDPAHPETLLAPTNAAVGLDVAGPLRMVAVALSPLGWIALTGRDAAQWADRVDEAGSVLGEAVNRLGEALRGGWRAGRMAGPDLAAALVEGLAGGLAPVVPAHARLVRVISEWMSASLDPALADLHAAAGYSTRQVQRLTMRYFGCSPKLLVRKYRALRVAALLQAPGLSDERIAQLHDLFYDQSHMIREIRHFTGRTPQRLLADHDTMLAVANSLENYTRIKPNIAGIPGD
jgi:AraC-like DNA-binding protein